MRTGRVGILLLLAAGGCAGVSKERGHDEVDRLVRERSGHQTRWAQGSPEDEQVNRWVGDLLAHGTLLLASQPQESGNGRKRADETDPSVRVKRSRHRTMKDFEVVDGEERAPVRESRPEELLSVSSVVRRDLRVNL